MLSRGRGEHCTDSVVEPVFVLIVLGLHSSLLRILLIVGLNFNSANIGELV
jgi:hypothetical protein